MSRSLWSKFMTFPGARAVEPPRLEPVGALGMSVVLFAVDEKYGSALVGDHLRHARRRPAVEHLEVSRGRVRELAALLGANQYRTFLVFEPHLVVRRRQAGRFEKRRVGAARLVNPVVVPYDHLVERPDKRAVPKVVDHGQGERAPARDVPVNPKVSALLDQIAGAPRMVVPTEAIHLGHLVCVADDALEPPGL